MEILICLVPVCAAISLWHLPTCRPQLVSIRSLDTRGAVQASCSIVGARLRNEFNPRRTAALCPFPAQANALMCSGWLTNEPGEVPVAVDQEQIAGEMKVLGCKFARSEFQLKGIIGDNRSLGRLRITWPTNQDRFPSAYCKRICLGRGKGPVRFVTISIADKVEWRSSGHRIVY
jgi:hypothetical protein